MIERLRAAGIDVNTDWQEGERVLQQANNRSVEKKRSGIYSDVFKQWFGDWELPLKRVNIVKAEKDHGFKNFAEAKTWARKNICRIYSDAETAGKGSIRISNRALEKYLSGSSIDNSISKDVHESVLKVLPSVIRESVLAETHPDVKKVDGVRSFNNGFDSKILIHRLYGCVNIDGVFYRVKVTLKDNKVQNEPVKAYNYEATSIEVLKEDIKENRVQSGLMTGRNLSPHLMGSISAAKVQQNSEITKLSSKKEPPPFCPTTWHQSPEHQQR